MSSPPSGITLSSQGTPALLDNTFGALLLSTFISLPLYGLTVAQTIQYARMYPSDRPFLKTLVAAIFISDTLHSACIIHICYYYFVTDYFDPAALFVNVWTVDILPLSMGITVILAQGFYTRRVYVVNYKYRLLVFFVVALMSVEFGSLIANTIVSFKIRSFEVLGHYTWLNTANFAIATVVDLVLTGAFVTIIRQSRTGFSETDAALDLLARYALFATMLLSALAIPAFVCSLVLWHSFVYIAIATPAAKVYANSVLAVLNCRKSLPRPGIVMDDLSEMMNIKLSVLRDRGRHQNADGNPRGVAGATSSHVVIDISAERARSLRGQPAEGSESKRATGFDGTSEALG